MTNDCKKNAWRENFGHLLYKIEPNLRNLIRKKNERIVKKTFLCVFFMFVNKTCLREGLLPIAICQVVDGAAWFK